MNLSESIASSRLRLESKTDIDNLGYDIKKNDKKEASTFGAKAEYLAFNEQRNGSKYTQRNESRKPSIMTSMNDSANESISD